MQVDWIKLINDINFITHLYVVLSWKDHGTDAVEFATILGLGLSLATISGIKDAGCDHTIFTESLIPHL